MMLFVDTKVDAQYRNGGRRGLDTYPLLPIGNSFCVERHSIKNI
mgnify:FL=1